MEAAKFIRQRNRMCGYYNNMPEGCYMCPAFNAAYHKDCEIATDNPEHLVAIVEKWAKEHPEETEQKRQEPKHPEESIDLHAIIDSLEVGRRKTAAAEKEAGNE